MQGSMWCHMRQEKVLGFWQLLPGTPFHWDGEPREGVDGETGGQGKGKFSFGKSEIPFKSSKGSCRVDSLYLNVEFWSTVGLRDIYI